MHAYEVYIQSLFLLAPVVSNIIHGVVIHQARSVHITCYATNATRSSKLPNEEANIFAHLGHSFRIFGQHNWTIKKLSGQKLLIEILTGINHWFASEIFLHSIHKGTKTLEKWYYLRFASWSHLNINNWYKVLGLRIHGTHKVCQLLMGRCLGREEMIYTHWKAYPSGFTKIATICFVNKTRAFRRLQINK